MYLCMYIVLYHVHVMTNALQNDFDSICICNDRWKANKSINQYETDYLWDDFIDKSCNTLNNGPITNWLWGNNMTTLATCFARRFSRHCGTGNKMHKEINTIRSYQ
jgi:hypothetical protein